MSTPAPRAHSWSSCSRRRAPIGRAWSGSSPARPPVSSRAGYIAVALHGLRRLSQRISEGDGIAIIVCVDDADAPRDVDAVTIRPEDDHPHSNGELEAVVDVRDEEELELALERLDPEIFLLSAKEIDDDADPLDAVLELLPDVPAGKLAIARVDVTSRDEVLALERAGIDAVLVPGGHVNDLVGHRPFDV